jgi:hypothetical protein
MKNKKEKSITRFQIIILQIFCALFLFGGLYLMVNSWSTLQKLSYSLSASVIGTVVTAGAPYIGFSVLLYGLSCVLEQLAKKNETKDAPEEDSEKEQ